MTKTYNVEQHLPNWLVDNADQIFTDILESCELHVTTGNDTFGILKIRTISGITEFKVSGKESAVNVLQKSERFFVNCEKYELAARARDCSKLWESI